MKDVRVLGVDLGKNSCSVIGLDASGRVLLRRRTRRDGVVGLAAKLPGCVVAMEACCGARHLGRRLVAQGHEVRLMSPDYVRPRVEAQKNDDRDAEAIAEAATRPTMVGSGAPDHGAQGRGAARRAGPASRPRPAGRPARLADEPDPLHPARAQDRGAARPSQPARRAGGAVVGAGRQRRGCARAAFCSTTCSINGAPSTRASRSRREPIARRRDRQARGSA